MILAGLGATDLERHPLALTVPDRAMTGLLAWPLTGQPPRQFASAGLTAGQERSPPPPRRCARPLSAPAATGNARRCSEGRPGSCSPRPTTPPPASADARDLRTPGDLRTWTPHWTAARSAAHVAGTAGDLDPLHRFIDQGLSDDRLISANLNYWADESRATWTADSAMTSPFAGTWDGTLLLRTLLRGIVHAPYRNLCARTLWALLLLRRPQLTSHQQLPAIKSAVVHALHTGTLESSAQQRLEQVNYLIRSA